MASIETASKISIISKALVLCGETPLTSLSDPRYGATVGNQLFELFYEEEVQSGSWRFAHKKRALSRLTDTPLNQWQFIYQLPTDMLLPRGVYPSQPYEIYGDHLYTNATTVDLEYLFKPEISDLPAYFAMLMVYKLTANFIKPITESDMAWQAAVKMYDRQRARAMYADAQGRPATRIVDSPFTDIR